jgi:hypothetical protein
MEIILSDNAHPFSIVKISHGGGQADDCRQFSVLYVGASVYLIRLFLLTLGYTHSI